MKKLALVVGLSVLGCNHPKAEFNAFKVCPEVTAAFAIYDIKKKTGYYDHTEYHSLYRDTIRISSALHKCESRHMKPKK